MPDCRRGRAADGRWRAMEGAGATRPTTGLQSHRPRRRPLRPPQHPQLQRLPARGAAAKTAVERALLAQKARQLGTDGARPPRPLTERRWLARRRAGYVPWAEAPSTGGSHPLREERSAQPPRRRPPAAPPRAASEEHAGRRAASEGRRPEQRRARLPAKETASGGVGKGAAGLRAAQEGLRSAWGGTPDRQHGGRLGARPLPAAAARR